MTTTMTNAISHSSCSRRAVHAWAPLSSVWGMQLLLLLLLSSAPTSVVAWTTTSPLVVRSSPTTTTTTTSSTALLVHSSSSSSRSRHWVVATEQEQDLATTTTTLTLPSSVESAKMALIEALSAGTPDDDESLQPYLEVLQDYYRETDLDARFSETPSYNGAWTNVNTPAFPGRLGFDSETGLPLYTIGRLTFNLIPSARDIVVAVQSMGQHVQFADDLPPTQDIAESLAHAVQSDTLRTNYLDTVFQIPNSKIRGILRMEGYTLPSLDDPNKYDTWFVGGRCLPEAGVDPDEWKAVFGQETLEYRLANTVTAYQTVLYLDEDLRVSRGNRGSLMIVGR